MRILLLGKDGQVGWELRMALASLGSVVAMGRAEVDLADADALRSRVREAQPQVIVNAAAYTQVDRAESEPELAEAVNTTACAVLAELAAELDALLLHYSTDYVFAGDKTSPYVESDTPAPLNVYGRTKLGGEHAILSGAAPHLVFRTSWVYATRGHNFLLTMRRLARERTHLRIVADQVGRPTWSRRIAVVSTLVLARLLLDSDWNAAREHSGLYHLAARGETSWHGFAEAIFASDPGRADYRLTAVEPVSTAEYAPAAPRPLYSVLDCSRLEQQFGVQLPDWRSDVELALGELSA